MFHKTSWHLQSQKHKHTCLACENLFKQWIVSNNARIQEREGNHSKMNCLEYQLMIIFVNHR